MEVYKIIVSVGMYPAQCPPAATRLSLHLLQARRTAEIGAHSPLQQEDMDVTTSLEVEAEKGNCNLILKAKSHGVKKVCPK